MRLERHIGREANSDRASEFVSAGPLNENRQRNKGLNTFPAIVWSCWNSDHQIAGLGVRNSEIARFLTAWSAEWPCLPP